MGKWVGGVEKRGSGDCRRVWKSVRFWRDLPPRGAVTAGVLAGQGVAIVTNKKTSKRVKVKTAGSARTGQARSGDAGASGATDGAGAGAETLGAFRAASYNPRTIREENAAALRESLLAFGDVSGLVVNRQTGNFVCGHQRTAALQRIDPELLTRRVKWGTKRMVEVGHPGDRFRALEVFGELEMPSGASVRVRLVDWPAWLEKAANLAANSQTLQGEWDEALLADLLAAVQRETPADSSGLIADLMLDSLLAKDEGKGGGEGKSKTIAESYQVVIECESEAGQRVLYERLRAEGLSCKLLTI